MAIWRQQKRMEESKRSSCRNGINLGLESVDNKKIPIMTNISATTSSVKTHSFFST